MLLKLIYILFMIGLKYNEGKDYVIIYKDNNINNISFK